MRAAVLDGEQLAIAVEDADLEVLPLDHPAGPGRQLGDGRTWIGFPVSTLTLASASDGGVSGSQSTAAPSPALLSTFSDSSAHFMRVAEMSIPSRSRTNVAVELEQVVDRHAR